MRSPTVAPAKPTWRVASMLARRLYLGCRDELRLARGIVARLWLSASRPACFARSFEFDERLGIHRGQPVRRLLSIACGTGGGLAVGVAAFVYRPSDHWFYSSFHFGAREALGPVSVALP